MNVYQKDFDYCASGNPEQIAKEIKRREIFIAIEILVNLGEKEAAKKLIDTL